MPKTPKAKKLVLVLETSASVTGTDKKAQVTQPTQEGKKIILDQVSCIHYPVQFRKDKGVTISTLINSGSEVNAMTLAYAKKLGLQTWKTDVKDQKIDGSLLQTYKMVIATFQVKDKLSKVRFT